MNRDSARKLSDSDFWQICHEMHPSTNYTFPVAPMLGVAENGTIISNLETLDERLGFDQHETTSDDVSSDDSLQNLFVKKSRAHRKLLSTHSNCVNTQKIIDTIDLFCDGANDKTGLETDDQRDKSVGKNDPNHQPIGIQLERSNEIDTINNADDLLLKIANSVEQLKVDVNQINGTLYEKSETQSPAEFVAGGDLIDFSDDWTNGESDNNSNTSDMPIKKATHSCVQGSRNDGNSSGGEDNERLPYITFECRKNFINNSTGRAAVETNETEYDAHIEVNNHRSGIQVNYCNEWHTENGNDYPSPTTSESSNSNNNNNNNDNDGGNGNSSSGSSSSSSSSSSCSYTDSLCNSSRSSTSDNLIETETSNGHTCMDSNSHTLYTEQNRRYSEFEPSCAHQTKTKDKTIEIQNTTDKSLPQAVGWRANAAISRAKINVKANNDNDTDEDNRNGACAVHTFVTFTHTIRDRNEVNSSIEPKPSVIGVESATQDTRTASSAPQLHSQYSHSTSPSTNETNRVHVNASIVVRQSKPKSLAPKSSFIQPLPSDTSTSADTFSLQKQAQWDADKNNNPLHYKDKRTKAPSICETRPNENWPNSNAKSVNFQEISIEKQPSYVQYSVSEKFVPILRESCSENSFSGAQHLSSASAASTSSFISCVADNKDEKHYVDADDVNAKICLAKNSCKTTNCKLNYRKTVHGCLCEHKLQISVRKSCDKFSRKCNKRQRQRQLQQQQQQQQKQQRLSGGEVKCRKKSNHCTKRQKIIQKQSKNRIGKQQPQLQQISRCNYKWKCCRSHLCDYDLCEAFLVTSKCGKLNSSPNSAAKALTKLDKHSTNGLRQSSENCANESKTSEKTVDHFTQNVAADDDDDDDADNNHIANESAIQQKCLSNNGNVSTNDNDSNDITSNITLPYSSATKRFDALKTTTTTTDIDQSLTPINKTIQCIDSGKRQCNRLIAATKSVSPHCVCDANDAEELKKALELTPPIEKIQQVLDAVKYSDTNLSVINCDLNCSVDSATYPTKCNKRTDSSRTFIGGNSLKNSLKFSESCDSIFTLKCSAEAATTRSLLALNAATVEPFEASNRLRRLEERFKDFAITSLVGEKGKCVRSNLSPTLNLPTAQHHQIQLDGKGHLNGNEQERQHQHDEQIDAPSSISTSPTKSVTDKTLAQKTNDDDGDNVDVVVATNPNEPNLNFSDNNNNDIKLKTSANEKPNETKQHICCTHTIQKRKQSEQLNSVCSDPSVVELNRRKSPIGVENVIETDNISTHITRQSTTPTTVPNELDDDDDHDTEQPENANHSSINKCVDLNAAQTFATNESQESSFKKDSVEAHHKKIDSIEDENENEIREGDKPNPNRKSSAKPLNDDRLVKINTPDSRSNSCSSISISIGGTVINSINFDDNKNNLEQILNDKNEPNGINKNGIDDNDGEKFKEAEEEEVCSTNANETKDSSTPIDVQQLDNIANRLINCTPVSISTESEEICNLFPENHLRDASESPFIYRDEELKTNCVFDVRQLSDFHLPTFDQIYECYDELDDDDNDDVDDDDDDDDSEMPMYALNVNQSKVDVLNNNNINNNDNDASLTGCDPEQTNFPSNYCQCTIESIVPLYPEVYSHTTTTTINNPNKTAAIMRDMTNSGTLRGLLKKPNRPAASQKNRVIFDETRNEFFDADYIILVRDDCPYDEEDEEPCTCGEHELVRLCCDEGCQCTAYAEDGRTPQSPKYAPPIEFVDQAALSPPEGYKDGGLQQALGGVLGSHIFGAQHIQQLQVIQRLQAKRAAMLAAQRSNNNGPNSSGSSKNHSVPPPPLPAQTICTECAECSECAAKQEHDEALPHMALLSIQATSPERRFTQKEIIAGEERPKYLLIKQHQDSVSSGTNATSAEKSRSSKKPLSQRYVVETITMTTVTERRVLHEETNTTNSIIIAPTAAATASATDKSDDTPKPTNTAGNESRSTYLNSDISLKPTSISAQITGILKGGKLWKNETTQNEETTSSATSDDETSKRSVRFIDGANAKNNDTSSELEQDVCDGESIHGSEQNGNTVTDTDSDADALHSHSMLFHNSLRPNSAVRQLFPSAVLTTNAQPAQQLTHEALRAFDESKRSQLKSSIVHSESDTDSIRRTIERNALRRSLIKYEPKKKPPKADTSLEERIRMLTCDVDEPSSSDGSSVDHTMGKNLLERRSSPTGEENPTPQPAPATKYVPEKSFSPISTASSSSSSSISAYKKITDIFHKDKRQERIPEADENPIVIIPQQLQADCRCPPAPDLGLGTHLPNANNQLATVRPSDARRQFLSTLAPLTACVAGQRDDMSFYSLATGDRNSTGSSRGSEYSIGDIDAILQNDDAKKVAPDVIAGTPGQEQNDELAAFAQQEATRTERIKKRYNNTETNAATSVPTSNAGSDDDDEQNDYGFNHRPSVRGIKPRSNEEMLEEMQTQLSSASVNKPPPLLPRKGGQSNTLPKANTQTLQSKLMSAMQVQQTTQSQQQQQQQQQQIASIVHQQNISTWNAYYQEQAQRNSLPANTPSTYFQQLPIHAARHSFHQEESTIYQNCQGVAMEQHYGHTIAARSPTRRPESPPPLRNYHQTMVLIPYNTEYAQFTADQIAQQHFQHQNILEYQQVTQQTIRVPIGYPLPGMQLHVVTGNGNQPAYAQYATTTRQQTQVNATPRPTYGYIQENQVPAAVKYTERGAPEGAASISQSDCNALMQQPAAVVAPANAGQNNVPVTSTANTTQTSNTSTTAQQGAVFYAMNV